MYSRTKMKRTEVPYEWNAQSWLIYPFKLNVWNHWLVNPFKLSAWNCLLITPSSWVLKIVGSISPLNYVLRIGLGLVSRNLPLLFAFDIYLLFFVCSLLCLMFLFIVCYMFVVRFLFDVPHHAWKCQILKVSTICWCFFGCFLWCWFLWMFFAWGMVWCVSTLSIGLPT